MNYDLAKKLKDAGFPQEDKHWYWVDFTFPSTLWCINALKQKKMNPDETWTACPTLSELIAACGEDFEGLMFNAEEKRWQSWARKERYVDMAKQDFPSFNGNHGTPEEAVATLWLALNKNQPKP